jgi:hypothetical protein
MNKKGNDERKLKPDIETEIKQIYSKIIEYSNILDETNFI